jgi:hypothetical protein
MREQPQPEGCRSSTLIWPPEGLIRLPCVPVVVTALTGSCVLCSVPGPIITILPSPLFSLLDPPAGQHMQKVAPGQLQHLHAC